jgi:hypothetical protein
LVFDGRGGESGFPRRRRSSHVRPLSSGSADFAHRMASRMPPQNAVPDPSLPFALTLSRQTPAASMSGENAPRVLDRFPTLAEAMAGQFEHAEELAPDAAPQLLAILDREDRLVLAGAACDGAVAWCHPVMSAAEARAVVSEASQLRAQAGAQRTGARPIWRSACVTTPIFLMPASSIRCGAPSPRGPCRSRRDVPETEEGRGVLRALPGERDRPAGSDPSPISGEFHDTS